MSSLPRSRSLSRSFDLLVLYFYSKDNVSHSRFNSAKALPSARSEATSAATSPSPLYSDVLLKQEATEDERLLSRAREVCQAGKRTRVLQITERRRVAAVHEGADPLPSPATRYFTASAQKLGASDTDYCLES